MYNLVGRLLKDKKTVGYSLMDGNNQIIKLQLPQVMNLLESGMIENATIGKNGKLKGVGTDLRTLPVIQLGGENSIKYTSFEVKNLAVRTTDYDSDLADAPYRNEKGRVFIVGCDIHITCSNKKSLEAMYLKLNNMEEQSIIQTYNDVECKEGYILSLRVLSYKPKDVIKFISGLNSLAKVKINHPKDIVFKRDNGDICNFQLNLKQGKVSKVAYNKMQMTNAEFELVNGMMGLYIKHIR